MQTNARKRFCVKIDIHSHILPGVDDGAKTMEDTIKMLEIATQEGIEAIIATPHYEVGVEEEITSKYQQAFEKVSAYIESHQIPLKLYRGNEIYYSESIPELLSESAVRTLNDTRYVLVEFGTSTGYRSIVRSMNALLYAGYRPIIAHTERYAALRDVKKVRELIQMGAYIQLNANAVIGKEGWHVKHYCKTLLKKHMVHVIGTDAHGCHHRAPKIKDCLEYIDKKFGRAYRKQLIEENPLKILEGEKISGEN